MIRLPVASEALQAAFEALPVASQTLPAASKALFEAFSPFFVIDHFPLRGRCPLPNYQEIQLDKIGGTDSVAVYL